MKNILKTGLILLVFAIAVSGCASSIITAQNPVTSSITYQTFYDNLSPYGTWIDYPGYGNVWNPAIETGFRPYATNGQWAYSNDGWMWQSNYNWGWAPFHYGRWLYDDMYGWLWIPGYDWSPAWVTWGYADNYYAWAPLMPDVNVGVQFGGWRPHSYYWNICGREHIYDRDIFANKKGPHNRITKNITIINNYSTSRNNNYYAKGPEVKDVERYTKQKIEPVLFKEVKQIKQTRQDGNVVKVYRPVIQKPQYVEMKKADNNYKNTGNINTGIPVSEAINKKRKEQNQNGQPVEIIKPGAKQPNQVNANDQPYSVKEQNKIIQQQYLNPQPREFRKAQTAQLKFINKEEQKPVMLRSEQRTNIEKLPVYRTVNMPSGNKGGNTSAKGKG